MFIIKSSFLLQIRHQIRGLTKDNYVFLREFKYFPRVALLGIICSLLASLMEGVGIGLIVSFLQGLVNPSASALRTGIQWFDLWFLGASRSPEIRLYILSGLIIGVTSLRAGLSYLGERYVGITQVCIVERLHHRIFDQLQQLSLNFFSESKTGELVNRVTTEIKQIRFAFGSISIFVTRGFSLPVYLVAIFILSWQLAIIAFLLLLVLSATLSLLKRQIRESSFAITRANGHFASVVIEFISGIFTVHTFAAQKFERQRFISASKQIARALERQVIWSSLINPLGEAISTSIMIGIVIIGFVILDIPIAVLLTFMFTLIRLVPLVRVLNGALVQFSRFQGPIRSIKELLETQDKPYFKNGNIIFDGFKNHIEFKNVSFSYDCKSYILSNINLKIEKGETIAIVGASGSGKTTLATLIPRLYDPQQGQVLIDDIDIRQFEIQSLRQKMAVVSQDAFIFNTSVKDNIIYPEESIDDNQIYKAAQLAHALSFIEKFPDGFDTQLGDRGVRLSGGQRQRIAIARAVLRDPEILILDEATSALDSITEKSIQSALDRLSVGRTVIVIAHRLSTIRQADRILVLEKGRIVEQGNYQNLLNQKNKFWHYHQVQYCQQ